MNDLTLAVRGFCARIMETEKLPPGTKIGLLGANNSPFYEMQAIRKDAGGAWIFSDGVLLVATLPQAYTVQFTVKGKPPFTREWRLTG